MHRSGKYPSTLSIGREHTEDPDPHRPDSRSDNNEPTKKDLLSDLFSSARTKHQREADLYAELTKTTAPPPFLPPIYGQAMPHYTALPTEKQKDEKINISIEAPVINITLSGAEQETPALDRTRVVIPACPTGCRTAKPRFKR